MDAVVREVVVDLEWAAGGAGVRAVLRAEDAEPADPPIPLDARHLRPDVFLADDLGEALSPPVRRRVRDEVARLETGQVLRLRLRLHSMPEDPLPLGSLAWEAVWVPAGSPDLHPRPWQEWVETGYSPTEGDYHDLASDPRFSLVREVACDDARTGTPTGRSNTVLLAGATSVHGPVTTRLGTRRVPAPPGDAKGDGDLDSVASVLGRGTRFEVSTTRSPAGADDIRRRLSAGPLALYFGGHHVDGGLVVAEHTGSPAADWLDGTELAGWLVRERVPLVVLMACGSGAVVAGGETGPGLPLAEVLTRAGVPYVVAVNGTVSDGRAREFAGAFFRALVDHVDVDLAVRRGSRGFARGEARPVLYTSRPDRPLRLEQAPETDAPELPSTAHRIPLHVARASDASLWPDDRYMVRLDAHLCLRDREFTEVIADPSGDDLAELLNRAEALLHRRGLAAAPEADPGTTRRQWYTHSPGRHLPSPTDGALRLTLSPAYAPGAPAGLVVRRAAEHPGDLDWLRYVEDLRRVLPEVRGVVVQVVGGGHDAALRSARAVAVRLGLDEHLLRTVTSEEDGDGKDLSTALRGLLDGRGDDVPTRTPLPADAVDVVVHLNDTGEPWGDPQAEASVLRGLRRAAPGSARELLLGHAARRTSPARWASLAVAALDDTDMAAWLQSARLAGRLPHPEEFFGLPLPERLVDAVVLGMLRGGLRDTPQLEAWLDAGPSAEVEKAAEAARRDTGLTAADLVRPAAAVALDRAGLLAATDFTALDPLGRRLGSWALLTRRQLTHAQVDWLYAMPPARRAMVGLRGTSATPVDHILDEELHALRRALRPLLPQVPTGSGG
ncbi:CHAT domain-containing protein [Streptomyces sp. NPDC013178]|uniref:CHAT domain-containing protein n=1 Tax=Streptomyces sp. NPDC013178 TaxID=3155118 RepID=UPI0033CC5DCC